MRPIALKRPVDTSHARGFDGTPSRGHCSSAVLNASCSAASAASKSPSRRMSVASTRRDSARYTELMVSLMESDATVADSIILHAIRATVTTLALLLLPSCRSAAGEIDMPAAGGFLRFL